MTSSKTRAQTRGEIKVEIARDEVDGISPAARQFLKKSGIQLVAILDVNTLPPPIHAKFNADTLEGINSLVLLAAAGPTLWRALRDSGVKPLIKADDNELNDHFVDTFSLALSQQFVALSFDDKSARYMYPGNAGDAAPPLIDLGELCGWSSPSYLGMGIHNEYGLWFAYRALIGTRLVLKPTTLSFDARSKKIFGNNKHDHTGDPTPVRTCERCISKDCVTHCPSGAVTPSGQFDLDKCAKYRLAVSSECELNCPARRACPVGSTQHYDDEQLEYHMGRSMPFLRRWYEENI